jgi:poly(beta-D-mannuronate) lyase
VFRAYANGSTTSGSTYPRSELREMANNGKDEASWSDGGANHTMTITQAITHLPTAKPEVVAGQIHNQSDDVIEIALSGNRLFAKTNGNKTTWDLDSNYQLGAVFNLQVVAGGGHINIYYNGQQKVSMEDNQSGLYFKAGCYTQSNTKYDSATAYGEVVIYGLQLS